MHEIEVYVRFSETDAAGHVNNTSYFIYFEEARIKYLEQISKDSKRDFLPSNVILVTTSCDYIAQAYAGKILKITTEVSHVGNKSFRVDHVLTLADTGTVIAKGTAVLACFNYEEQKTVPIPDEIRVLLERKLVSKL
ncbi:acyl-CoA thioesterase [Oceanobacillus sp. CF4.6]|uniref:acyl-CoA thioesterase n=1 Tax=Oceanobacillus sp. CF4.6 TaxID=3373080 RepID=UPI003EE5006C